MQYSRKITENVSRVILLQVGAIASKDEAALWRLRKGASGRNGCPCRREGWTTFRYRQGEVLCQKGSEFLFLQSKGSSLCKGEPTGGGDHHAVAFRPGSLAESDFVRIAAKVGVEAEWNKVPVDVIGLNLSTS